MQLQVSQILGLPSTPRKIYCDGLAKSSHVVGRDAVATETPFLCSKQHQLYNISLTSISVKGDSVVMTVTAAFEKLREASRVPCCRNSKIHRIEPATFFNREIEVTQYILI